jgi:hypothetical protein
MPRALCMIREDPVYRRHAFVNGLKLAGFDVCSFDKPKPDDVLVIWNRYGPFAAVADNFERVGAAVIIAENGYLGHSYNAHAKASDKDGAPLYALALQHHNGAGKWFIGEPGRWRRQGIQVKPWRKDGKYVLVLPQRGIGPPGIAMPMEWVENVMPRLGTMTKRRVVLRAHPGNEPAARSLDTDLENAWCVVVWGSGAGLKAICAGVPAFTDFDSWIGRGAALTLKGADLEQPLMDDHARETMLDRVAWAQWSIPEIIKGEPFKRLMEIYRDAQSS